ncbi:MAG: YdcF family protein [Planctomycetota bacterium]
MADERGKEQPGVACGDKAPQAKRTRRFWRLLRWFEHLLLVGCLGFVVLLVSPIPWWLYEPLDRQGELRPAARYVICLGGGPARVIEGARLLQEGYAEKLIVSNNGVAVAMMRDLAIDWGAPADRILVDTGSHRTLDHPGSIRRQCGVNPAEDLCIIVTSYSHMARSLACFQKAGYRHIIMREPRWERQFRSWEGWKTNCRIVPELVYEYGGFVEYWLRGAV